MGRLAIKLISVINDLIPATRVHRELALAKKTPSDYQRWEYREIQRIYEDFEPYWDLKGRLVLDLGCGLGGKLLFYADQGAEGVVGIDLRPQSARAAGQLAAVHARNSTNSGIIRIAAADGAVMPFAESSFDAIVSINVLEHVADPATVLRECRRVLRPDGRLFLHFPPFFSPWGAHLDPWLKLPWVHLVFLERDLVRVAARVEVQERYNDRYIPSAQVHWADLDELPELNRLTYRQFHNLVAAVGLRQVQCRLLPFGRHVLRRGPVGRFLLRFLYAIAHIPLLNEVVVTKIACVMNKEG